jgi:antitoxin (DNA-binding transcriptional repressor) of toxin-antitoxin stability system
MVLRFGQRGKTMEEVAISEFKAKCLALLQRVNKTKKPIRVTRFGKPVRLTALHVTLATCYNRGTVSLS